MKESHTGIGICHCRQADLIRNIAVHQAGSTRNVQSTSFVADN